MKFIKPKKILKGDLIGIISPASSPEDLSVIEKGVRYFEKLNYRVKVGKHVGNLKGYLAGTDEERVEDIHSMFTDKYIRAVICVRGGYGAFRLLDKIDYRLIKNNPKIFVGYSEITSLQNAFLRKAGLITFAGPMLSPDIASNLSEYTEDIFWRSLTSNKKLGRLKFPDVEKLPGINRGGKSGRIIGGNLAVFAGMIGTAYLPEIKNSILMLEDVGELPYKVDRLMNQLRLNNIFKQISGLLLGRFIDCYEHNPEKRTLTLGEIMDDYLRSLNIPIVYTFPHGHVKDKITVPLGINVKINAIKGFVEFTESAVR